MRTSLYFTDLSAPGPEFLRCEQCRCVEARGIVAGLRCCGAAPAVAGTGLRHVARGAVAKAELCSQEAQWLVRQIEAIRCVVLPVGEGHDVGPESKSATTPCLSKKSDKSSGMLACHTKPDTPETKDGPNLNEEEQAIIANAMKKHKLANQFGAIMLKDTSGSPAMMKVIASYQKGQPEHLLWAEFVRSPDTYIVSTYKKTKSSRAEQCIYQTSFVKLMFIEELAKRMNITWGQTWFVSADDKGKEIIAWIEAELKDAKWNEGAWRIRGENGLKKMTCVAKFFERIVNDMLATDKEEPVMFMLTPKTGSTIIPWRHKKGDRQYQWSGESLKQLLSSGLVPLPSDIKPWASAWIKQLSTPT